MTIRKTPLPCTLGILLVFLSIASSAFAQDGHRLSFSTGLYDTAAWSDSNGDFNALEAGVEFRWSHDLFLGISPVAGVTATDESAFWLYAGGRRPWNLGDRWSTALSFAVSYYEQGDGKDLGHELEFRSGIDFERRFRNDHSLGLELYHLSNASISETNPGSNSLRVTYSMPIGNL